MSLKTYDASKSAFVERDKVKIYKNGAWGLIESAKAYKSGAWEEMFYSGIPLHYENSYGSGFTITPYEVAFANETPGKFIALSVTFSGWVRPTISFDWYVGGSGTLSGFYGVSPRLQGYYNGSPVYDNSNLFNRVSDFSGSRSFSISEQVTKLVFTFSCNKSYSDLETVVYGIKNLVIHGEKYKLC